MTALFATTYIIDDYNFIFEGSTDVSIVYSKLGLESYTSFDSYEEMEAYVKEKEQEISNWDVFNNTESSLCEVETSGLAGSDSANAAEKHYIAVFEINDKSPFFIFPTPKYDSNTGISFGIKMDSKNFVGKLASFTTKVAMEQKDNSFETADYSLLFNLAELPIASFKMDTSLSYTYDASKEAFLKGSSLTFGTSLYDIKLGDTVTFRLDASIKVNSTDNDLESFGIENFSYNATLANLFMDQGGFNLSQGLTYYPRTEVTKTNYKISYFGFQLKDRPVTVSLELATTNEKGGNIIDFIKEELVSIPFVLPFSFNFTPSLILKTTYETNGNPEMEKWTATKEVIISATLSRSGINRDIDGNQDFKKGISFSLTGSRTMYIANLLNETSQYATLSVSWFAFATSWINPSIRITGIISKLPTKSLFGVNVSDNTYYTKMAEYMRGIRNDNSYNKDSWNAMVIANVNITTKCINLGSWARTYAIPFVDVAYLTKLSDEPSKWLCSVGIEGIGIINDHSNYPVRASLGFNAESLKKFAETENFDDLEYEIFFGLGFFY